MTPRSPTLAVQTLIDEAPLSRFQIVTFLLCFAILVLDGYDTVVVGYIAPALKAHFGATPAQLAPMFGAGLFGLTIGSFVFGPVADRFGRKPTLLASIVIFALFSLLSAWADSIPMLTVLRFLTGLGLGGAMPNAYTLAAEYCPARLRATLVAPIGCGIAAGGALGGLAAPHLIGAFGWQSMLVAGGVLPVILLFMLARWLPESVRHLVAHDERQAEARAIVTRIAPHVDLSNAQLTLGEARVRGFPVGQLLRPGIGGGTILLWITAFMALFVIYFLGNWLPILIQQSGVPFREASLMTALYLTGNSLGAILLGVLMDRFNPQYVLAVAFVCAAASLASFGHLAGHPTLAWLSLVALFVTGVGTGGTMTGTNILSTGYYPTAARATGVAWTLGMGRVGSIVGSMIGGAMLAAHWLPPSIFEAVAVPIALAALSVCALAAYRARHPSQVAASARTSGEPRTSGT
ncbi:aromatic acid/H+ symport family MFS transporter [Caballeronia sp. J97]|uniref:MFS transporter n=1 Tax=Caballeronia sp. J97 TaxID=2805429 RepID=UPI002AB16F77|nr:aromatic acid/H+ symport family MFS transporter [Caballeronia sp. J97]